jgi:hypothetical protein
MPISDLIPGPDVSGRQPDQFGHHASRSSGPTLAATDGLDCVEQPRHLNTQRQCQHLPRHLQAQHTLPQPLLSGQAAFAVEQSVHETADWTLPWLSMIDYQEGSADASLLNNQYHVNPVADLSLETSTRHLLATTVPTFTERSATLPGQPERSCDPGDPYPSEGLLQPFIKTMYEALAQPHLFCDCLVWDATGVAFIVNRVSPRLLQCVLPNMLGHTSLESFGRHLSMLGFTMCSSSALANKLDVG